MYSEERSIYLTLLIAGVVVITMAVFFLLNIIRYQRKRRNLSQKELETELRILEEDRARAAEELHDGLGSLLSAVKLRLQAIGPSSQKELKLIEEAEASLDHVQYILRKAPPRYFPQFVFQRGLKRALEDYLAPLNRHGGCRFNCTIDVPRLPNDMKLNVYRLLQEAVHNIIRHAGATEASLTITHDTNHIFIRLSDNGKGFDRDLMLQKTHGIGLRNIRARADMLGAKATLETAPQKGTTFTFKIPFKS